MNFNELESFQTKNKRIIEELKAQIATMAGLPVDPEATKLTTDTSDLHDQEAIMSFERKSNKVKGDQIKVGDLMVISHYVKVKTVGHLGNSLMVTDVDHDKSDIEVRGPQLIENAFSADQFHETIKVNKTTAAELLVSSHNRPFSVCFEKVDGTDRTLRGRLIKPEPLLGRSMVEDLDTTDTHRLRQVDHRTIKWLIVDGAKYIVK